MHGRSEEVSETRCSRKAVQTMEARGTNLGWVARTQTGREEAVGAAGKGTPRLVLQLA